MGESSLEKPLPEPRPGPIALVRWAWGAYREVRARGLLGRDPLVRILWRSKPINSLRAIRWMALVGAIVFMVLIVGNALTGMDETISLNEWPLYSLGFSFFSILVGASVFHGERERGTLDAFLMLPLPREVLLAMRFLSAIYLVLCFWGMWIPVFLLPPIIWGNGWLFVLNVFFVLLLFGLILVFSAYGTAVSVRHRSLVVACAEALGRLVLDWILIALRTFFGGLWRTFLTVGLFGVYGHVILAFDIDRPYSMGPPLWLLLLGPAVVFGILALQLFVTAPLRMLRRAALHFDEWAAGGN